MNNVIKSNGTGLIFAIIFLLSVAARAEVVELKFVVKESEVPKALSTFTQGDDGDARNIYFMETDDMALSKKGVILRLRENPGKRDDSTVKLRGRHAANLPDAEFPEIEENGQESKAEKDKVIGGSEARSFSITEKQRQGEIMELCTGKRELKELFSDQQEKFLQKYAQGVDWQRALLLGPVKTEKWKLKPEGFPRELTAELWQLPKCEQKQVLEFSTKVEESDAAEVERSLLELMKRKEVAPSSSPESKTQAVLKCLLKEARR